MSKTKFTVKDIRHLSDLIKLELSQEEAAKFAGEMDETVKYIENLDELPTAKAEPTYQTTGIANRFLDEKVNERTLPKQKLFNNIPAHHNGFFKIKGMEYSK